MHPRKYVAGVLLVMVALTGLAVGEMARPEKLRVAVIGSSYTAAAGGQQHLVKALLESQGWDVEIGTSQGPGQGIVPQYYHSLDQLTPAEVERAQRVPESEAGIRKLMKQMNPKFAKLAESGPWDVIILGTYPPNLNDAEAAATALAGTQEKFRVRSPQARFVIYAVWVSQDKPEEQPKLRALWRTAARQHGAELAACGTAMHRAHTERPELGIFRSPQDSHPGVHGTYLNACLLYATITGASPVGLPNKLLVPRSYDFPVGVKQKKEKGTGALDETESQVVSFEVSSEIARYLQQTAWDIHQARE